MTTEINDICIAQGHVVPVLFLPSAWSSAVDTKRDWIQIDFPPVPRNGVPPEPGVYAFVVEPSMFNLQPANGLFYVGKATNLYTRIGAYISELNKSLTKTKRPKVWKMLNQWNGHIKYYYTTTTDVPEAEALEKEMLRAFRPPFNTQYDAEISASMRAF